MVQGSWFRVHGSGLMVNGSGLMVITIDSLSEIVAQSLGMPDLSKLRATDSDKSHGHKKAIVSLIP